MTKRPKVDTEPDDAFAAVLGEIDSSPLMRTPDVPVSEKKIDPPRSKAKKTQKPKRTEDQSQKKSLSPQPDRDTAPDKAQDEAPSKAPDQAPDRVPDEALQENRASEAGKEPQTTSKEWTTRRESGCMVVSPPLSLAEEIGDEAPAQLRALLLALVDKDTPCVRIDLTAIPHLDASSLAVLLSFASLLEQREGSERLEIAARDGLAQFLCLCKVEETHPITLVEE